MTNEPKTVAGAYAKIETHEEICAFRYNTINATLADLKDSMRWIFRGMVGVLIAIVGYVAATVYSSAITSRASAAPIPVERVVK